MDEQGIKRLLSKKPIAKLLLISLFLGLLLLYIAEKKDYIMALMCLVTLTDGEQGKAFLNDKSYLFGNLKNLPVYYIGYDTLLGYEEENGEVWGEQKIGSVYYLYINDKIVLCEFSSSSKHPKDVLYGRTRLCYVQPLNENPVMYEIQHDIVEDTRGTTNPIRITDFSSKVLHLMSLDEMLYKQGKVILTVLVTLILLREWLKSLLLIISIRSCRSIRWAIKQYGALVKIYEKIAEEESIILSEDILLTKNWLVHGKAREIIYCDDIVWIYHKLNIIPFDSSRTYFYTKDGKRHRIYNWSTRNIYEVYDLMKKKRPWIIEGDSKERHKAWRLGVKYFVGKYEKKEAIL